MLIIGASMVLGVAYLMLSRMYLEPAAALDARISDAGDKIAKARNEISREPILKARLKDMASRTYDSDPPRAAEAARSRLTFLLQASGINQQGLTLQPNNSTNNAGLFSDVGWSIHAKGPINAIVNFLYLIQHDPRVSRLENITLTPVPRSDQVDMKLRYGTLVLLPEKAGAKAPAADVVPVPLPAAVLDDPHRQAFQLIVERNLFRPYLPRGNVYVASSTGDSGPAQIPVESAQYRVVGLPEANGQPVIMVRDTVTNATASYKPGDTLVNTTIIGVDYRQMPLPGKPFLSSGSRVIVRAENAYWAVELGQTFADRYRLAPEQLPPSLPKGNDATPVSETPQPAEPQKPAGDRT
jgi:hypothetical protein